jgi:hypothetical protein
MQVYVKPGSPAARGYGRRLTAAAAPPRPVPTKPAVVRPTAIAPGFDPRPDLDLHDRGGKIIPDLVFTNLYVGGDAAWQASDRSSIDDRLARAMSDPRLNNVMVQFFRGAAQITSTFRPSRVLPGQRPDTVSQAEVEQLVTQLFNAGQLQGFDFGATVFNFLLPRGTVLTIDDGSDEEAGRRPAPGGARTGETEEAASSLRGLGGFHGSVDVGNTRLYYAVGVFSEGNNGIVAFDQPWKNVVATFYHELNEARTDADVETGAVAWVTDETPGEEIGDIPMSLAGGDLSLVMKEVPLADGSGTVPIQLMWSNAVHGPEGPVDAPEG